MLWKELHVSRTSGLVKAIGLGVAMVLGGLLMYGVYSWGSEAVKELIAYGYGSSDWDTERSNFNGFLRWSGTVAYVLWILAVAGTAAGAITTEREGDTWTSLITTPLDSDEILRAKMLGPIWTLRGLGALIVLLWTIGLVTGSVHPFGYTMALLEFAVFTWFAVSLGTFVSLKSKSTMRAQATTIGILVLTNGGYLLCCLPFQPDTPMIAAGCTPFIEVVSLLSFADVRSIFDWSGSRFRPGIYREAGEIATACAIGLFGYGAAAWGLTMGAFASFDQAADRPRIGSEMWQLPDDPGLSWTPPKPEVEVEEA
jgi:hypothetical protein